MKPKIALIGSRDIDDETSIDLIKIGRFVVEQGWWAATGNAIGSDQAYARGANQVNPARVILYLPEPNYNAYAIHPENKIVSSPDPEWSYLAARHHPRYALLDKYMQWLMDRNAGIVRNAQAVVAFRNRKKLNGGGTGHGFTIAQALDIPHLDISYPDNLKKVFDWLKEIISER